MSRQYPFAIADVFTRTPFGGNQLAVIPDARGLSEQRMQDLAREFGFSETTFVFPAQEHPRTTRRLRIFTPTEELPFAGHPTVGTASVLAAGGHVDVEASGGTLTFEEEVGPITVEVAGAFSRLTTMTPYQTPRARPSPTEVASALSLTEEKIHDCWYGGVGLKFCYVHLDSVDSVDRAALDKAAWAAGIAGGWSPHLYVFAGEFRDDGSLYARSFVPGAGVEEDPATGSAAAGLVAALAEGSSKADAEYHLRIDQGVRMGRPSQIDTTARTAKGRLTHVTVGGFTTIVGTGTITLLDD